MNADVRKLLTDLMNGCYLRHRVNHDGKPGYTLYAPHSKQSPESWLKKSQVNPLKNVLLKNKLGELRISPYLILKLHGNSSIKKHYKKMRAVIKKHSKELGS